MFSPEATFWPMIAHAALVLVLYVLLLLRRRVALKSGRVDIARFAEGREEPAESLLVHNNIRNQFELPVLFHAVCLALYVSTADNAVTVALSWVFVLSRYVHSAVHVTRNHLGQRRLAFAVGAGALVLLWLWLAVWLALN